MPPQTIQLALFIIEEAVKYGPTLATELQELLKKPDATPADWEALRARVNQKSYFDLVPDSALPRP